VTVITSTQLAADLSALVNRWNTREYQMIDFISRPSGNVTVTDGAGINHSLPSFPQMQLTMQAHHATTDQTVQAMGTRVTGLESAGHNSNLLTNSTFNSGQRGWAKLQGNSTWTLPKVDLLGDDYHPAGIHSLGIQCPNSTLDGASKFGQVYSAMVPVIPGRRYMASCHIANRRCEARMYIFWRSANAYLSSTASSVLARNSGGTDLNAWHHAVVSGTAPDNAAYAQLVVRFRGDGGENPIGWIIRPMLEQAQEHQTAPSPWNPGGLELAAAVEHSGSPSQNGWIKRPDGVIEQWGLYLQETTSETARNVTFPIAFPNECWNVTVSDINNANTNAGEYSMYAQVKSSAITKAKFTVFIQAPGNTDKKWQGMYWRAIGH